MVNIRDKIVKIKTDKLVGYTRNNKKHPERQIALLKENILEFGFTQPLLINKDNTIIAGHGRYLAAVGLGMEEVPCIKITDLTEIQQKSLRIADNKLSELADTDTLNLKEEYKLLVNDDSNLDFLTGYRPDEFKLTEDPILTPKKKDTGDGSGKRMKHVITCPKCDHEFNVKND